MALPYESSTAKDPLSELNRALAKFGCQTFGVMTDAEAGKTIVQFKWRERQISVEASWKGYAQAWLKSHPVRGYLSTDEKMKREQKALAQARISVGCALRDWIKGQITAIECGVMSFEAAFMPHILLPSGERVIDRVQANLLPPPAAEKVVQIGNGNNGS